MNEEGHKKENLSRLLGEVDNSLIEEALAVDNEKKFKNLKNKPNRNYVGKNLKFPLYRFAGVGVVVLACIIGIVAIFPRQDVNKPNKGNEIGGITGEVIPPSVEDENTDPIGAFVDSIDKVNYFAAKQILEEGYIDDDDVVDEDITVNNQPIAPLFDIDRRMFSLAFDALGGGGYAVDESDFDRRDSTDTDSYNSVEEKKENESEYSKVESVSESFDYPIDSTTESSDGIIYYYLNPNEKFQVSSVTYFKMYIDDADCFLASKVGVGEIEVVVTENSIDDMVTFKNGDKFYSCLNDSKHQNSLVFSTHKYVENFYIVKNLEQENYSFEICYSNVDEVSMVKMDAYPNHGEESVIEITSETLVSYEQHEFTIVQLEEYVKTGRLPTQDNSENGGSESTDIPPVDFVNSFVYVGETHYFCFSEDNTFVYCDNNDDMLDYRKGYWEKYDESILLVFIIGCEEEKTEVYIIDASFTYNGDVYYLG